MEGINDQQHNQMTLHSGTSNPCTIDTTNSNSFTGTVLNQQCYSTPTSDSGCSIQDSDTSSFGYGFNDAGGGVFALLWDTSAGMSLWHFARADIPSDITEEAPTPSNWGSPAGFWSAATCDISDNFYDHVMIFDTTICGNWAGGAYSQSGCPGTCSEMVANATNFAGESVCPCVRVLWFLKSPIQTPSGGSTTWPSTLKCDRTSPCRSLFCLYLPPMARYHGGKGFRTVKIGRAHV